MKKYKVYNCIENYCNSRQMLDGTLDGTSMQGIQCIICQHLFVVAH